MPVTERLFRGEAAWGLLANARHVIDLPDRLSYPPMQAGEDARLWLSDDGTLIGFAAWQRYWAMRKDTGG